MVSNLDYNNIFAVDHTQNPKVQVQNVQKGKYTTLALVSAWPLESSVDIHQQHN